MTLHISGHSMHHLGLLASLLSWFRGTASSDKQVSLAIESQSLQSTLCEFARHADLQVLTASGDASNLETLTGEAALRQLFSGWDAQRETGDSRAVFVHHGCHSFTEIIVTAQKCEERQFDVPVTLTLCDGSEIECRSSRSVRVVTGSVTVVRTFRLNTPYYSVYIRLHVSHPRSLISQDNFSASPIGARSRCQRRASYRTSGSSTSFGFSRVQRLVV
jgi:hypothetical protein